MSDIDKDLDNLAIDDDDITARHRKERKELQAKVQALKKTAGKGDKKKKKEVLEEIARLESDLNQRHDNELAQSSTKEPAVDNSNQIDAESHENADDEGTARVSRAQKRREKKAAEEKTRQAEILAQEELNKTGPRVLETTTINKLLLQRGLMLQPISSDGNEIAMNVWIFCIFLHFI